MTNGFLLFAASAFPDNNNKAAKSSQIELYLHKYLNLLRYKDTNILSLTIGVYRPFFVKRWLNSRAFLIDLLLLHPKSF